MYPMGRPVRHRPARRRHLAGSLSWAATISAPSVIGPGRGKVGRIERLVPCRAIAARGEGIHHSRRSCAAPTTSRFQPMAPPGCITRQSHRVAPAGARGSRLREVHAAVVARAGRCRLVRDSVLKGKACPACPTARRSRRLPSRQAIWSASGGRTLRRGPGISAARSSPEAASGAWRPISKAARRVSRSPLPAGPCRTRPTTRSSSGGTGHLEVFEITSDAGILPLLIPLSKTGLALVPCARSTRWMPRAVLRPRRKLHHGSSPKTPGNGSPEDAIAQGSQERGRRGGHPRRRRCRVPPGRNISPRITIARRN